MCVLLKVEQDGFEAEAEKVCFFMITSYTDIITKKVGVRLVL